MSNNNNTDLISVEQNLQLSYDKLKEMLVKNEKNKIGKEINNVFNILIKSEKSAFSNNSLCYVKNILNILEKFIIKEDLDSTLIIIKEIYFLLSNIKSKEILVYIFSLQDVINIQQGTSMNIFDYLISIDKFNQNEDFLNHQVNLMKSLILKVDSETIEYFYNKDINFFPILNKSLLLYDYPDNMLRGAIHNILLLITKNKNQALNDYLTSFPVALYYVMIIYDLKKIILELSFEHIKDKNAFEYFEEKHENLYDTVLYVNDVLLCDIENINFILINCLLNEIIFPLFNVVMSKTKENISVINAIYILSFFIYYIKNNFIINIISYLLLTEKIPNVFFEKINTSKFTPLNKQLINDINFLIKNLAFADINDDTWKRNSEFIRQDIGMELNTGKKCEDNNYDVFINMMNKVKDNKGNNIDFNINEIFICICELMTSQDENFIININILFYNIINHYKNFFKNDQSEESEDSIEEGTIKKNKILNTKIETNDLNKINNRSISKYQNKYNNTKTLFNPFLLYFIDFTKINHNFNNTNLLKILFNLIKNRNKFRIFTNELILNTLLLLLSIFCLEQKYVTREVYNLIKEMKLILKEEINNIKSIMNNKSENFDFNILISIYKYYKNQTFDSKISDIMKTFYILTIPFMHSEKNDKIPFLLKEEKSKDFTIKNKMLIILILLDIIQKTNKSNKAEILFNVFEKDKEVNNNYEIGKTYNKNNIGNEYGFCFIGDNYDDFKFNVQSIKKCLFIFSNFHFHLGEIISKTFKNISDIKIISQIPILALNIQESLNEKTFLEIKDMRNSYKVIMNCFNDDNTKKVHNYLSFMINNNNDFEKNEFNLFFQNIENKILKY